WSPRNFKCPYNSSAHRVLEALAFACPMKLLPKLTDRWRRKSTHACMHISNKVQNAKASVHHHTCLRTKDCVHAALEILVVPDVSSHSM
ncbi:mCG123705, partial [Mus musculus]